MKSGKIKNFRKIIAEHESYKPIIEKVRYEKIEEEEEILPFEDYLDLSNFNWKEG